MTLYEDIDLLWLWDLENKIKLRAKMERLGINQGGLFLTPEKNLALYKQLVEETKNDI